MQYKDIQPINKKNNPHGYWEIYWNNNRLRYKSFLVNGVEYGYEEIYDTKGIIRDKRYYAR